MKKKILERSKDFANKGLKNYVEGENEHFLVNLAISSELLGKAYLADIHPSLIIDRDFDSLLHACGAGEHARKSPTNIRTLGAKEVFNRCSQILPKLKEYEETMNILASIRSGLVHLGDHDAELAKKVFTPYLKHAKIILEALNIGLKDFFGEFSDIASTNIKDSRQEIEIHVQTSLAKARSDFKQRFQGMEKEVVKGIIKTLEESYVLTKYEEENTQCPICKNLGVVSGSFEVEKWEVDVDRDGNPEGAYPVVKLHCDSFKCRVCGLELESSEALESAGIEPCIDLENVDPADFYDMDEDGDRYYGR